ncbi:MAG TPA: hypothetical protein VER78_00435 [Thermoanaerobaculia bacterium]|nr:hypothetical protein [Thermoanaerobaculia bacterium]
MPVTEDRAPHTAYLPHGTDRVETAPDGAVWLICARSKGWTARRATAHSTAEYAGTAVRWGTELFEVVDAVTHADGTVRYKLLAWESRHVVRSIRQYDASSERERSGEQVFRKKSIAKRFLAILFSPLLGHLPGWVQERMESEFGAPALAMTIVSVLPLLALGFISVLLFLAAAYGAGLGVASGAGGETQTIPRLLPLPLALYLFAESSIRLGAAFLQSRPIGSLPGTVLFEIWNTLRGRPYSPPQGIGLGRTSPTADRSREDRYRMLEPLLGLLSPDEQDVLADRFGFESVRWGRRSAVVLAVVAGLNALASLLQMFAGAAGAVDLVWLAVGAGLFLEQLGRWQTLSRGRPAGSLLGGLVRPMARKLLKAELRAP